MTIAGLYIDVVDVFVLLFASGLLYGRNIPKVTINCVCLISYIIYSVLASNYIQTHIELTFIMLACICSLAASAHYAIKSQKSIIGLLVIMTCYNYAIFLEWAARDYGFFDKNYQLFFTFAFAALLLHSTLERWKNGFSRKNSRDRSHNNSQYFVLYGGAA